MNEGTTMAPEAPNGRALGLRRRLVLGTALATSAFVGGYRGYVRRAHADCTGAGSIYTCSGVTTTTQTLDPVTPLTVTTDNTFSIDTSGSGGDAFLLNGTGGLIFTDNNQSTITGNLNGIYARNRGGGVLSITATGVVTGAGPAGIYARNEGTDLTIEAAHVSGGLYGIDAHNYGTGALSITATGTVNGPGQNGINARNRYGTDLTIAAADVSGGTNGIVALNNGVGALSITATGTVTGTVADGIFAYAGGNATDLTITAADVSGGRYGITANNNGVGALSITATGTVTGAGPAGIYARNEGTDLTIEAVDVSGGNGINAGNSGSGALSITATGVVTGVGSDGILAFNFGTDLAIEAADVSGSRIGIYARNTGSGALSITATGAVTGDTHNGIYVFNNAGTDLTIDAADVSGGASGIDARNFGSGALSITTTGAVTGTSNSGIEAYSGSTTTGLTIEAADVSGGFRGIGARSLASGALSITATGTVTGTSSDGIYAYNYGSGALSIAASGTVSGGANGILAYAGSTTTDLTIEAADVSGGLRGIQATNVGGALSVTASGTVTGTSGDGIYARNDGTNLTIEATDVSGGARGIWARNHGGGALSITATGAVNGSSAAGIFVDNGGTDLTIDVADVSGGGYGIFAVNGGSGALSITTSGAATGAGTYSSGIFARNYGTDLTITAADVSGEAMGIYARNDGSGALSISTTGAVAGTSNIGIYARNNSTGTDLTIQAADVSGENNGIYARHYGSGALSITASGSVTGTSGDGIYANVGSDVTSTASTGLTIEMADVSGVDRGIVARNFGSGALAITATGTVTGASSDGISAANVDGTDLTISAVDVSGGNDGIYANSFGGALSITATGTVIGTSYDGIFAFTGGAATGLTIEAANVSGGRYGIYTRNYGSGALSITTTGAVTGNGDSGIYALNNSAAAGSTTMVMVEDGSAVSGATAGVQLLSETDRAANLDNAGSITGATGILASGGPTTISNAGAVTGTGGTAIDLTAALGPSTVNQQGGTITGDILLSAAADTVNVTGGAISGDITGQGNAELNFALGGGTFTVDTPFAITGMADVNVNSGTVVVDGSIDSAATAVADGAELGGSGSIAGPVTVEDGGTLAPGSSAGTLTVGTLTLSAGSILDYELGQAGVVGGGVNDLIEVTGDLTLDGTLNIIDIGGFGPGVYRLMNYGGALTDNELALGGLPTGVDAGDLFVQTRIAGEVNLISSVGADLNFWDGGDTALHDNGVNDGGSGVWDAASRNWTEADGMPNGQWNQDFAIFGGAAGTVTVDNSAGDVFFTGMQFMTDGYVIEGDALTTDTAETVIRTDLGVTATVATEIAGSGGLVKQDSGTLVLSGANSFTGGTSILNGTLQVSADANLGAVSGGLTFDGGTLRNTAAFMTARDITLGDGGGRFEADADLTASGVLSGAGTLTKTGTGTLTLTGNSNGFAGTTSVHAGTLAVNGTLGGAVDVLSGGRLQGAGTVGTTDVADGATIAPGNSIDTLSVAGDITFASGSTYEVEIEPDLDGDLIDASGAATIDGGTVHVLKAAGTYTPGSRWTIISTDGGVTGGFDDLTQNMPFVDLTLAYDPDNVYLDVARNAVSFCDIAQTRNQCSTGDGLESTGAGNPIYDALAAIPDEDSARQVLDALSGEIHAAIKGAMLEDSRFVREAASDRIRSAFGGVAAPFVPVMGYGPDRLTPEERQALAKEGKSAIFAPATADTDRLAVWVRGFGSWGEWDNDGNAAAFERSIGGLFIGADAPIGDWRVGALAGYSHSSFHADDRASSGSSDNYHVSLFGGTEWGNLGFRAGAAHTWHDIETSRSIAFPGFADSAEAAYDARTAQVFGELGYRIDRGAIAFEPFANLAYVNVHTDGFTEDGGAAALTSDSSTTDATFTTLGLRASTDLPLGGIKATARGMVGWRHAFGDVTPLTDFAFTSGDAFTIAGTPIAEDALVLEAGIDVGLSEKASLGLSYSGQIGDGASDHGVRADFTLKF